MVKDVVVKLLSLLQHHLSWKICFTREAYNENFLCEDASQLMLIDTKMSLELSKQMEYQTFIKRFYYLVDKLIYNRIQNQKG